MLPYPAAHHYYSMERQLSFRDLFKEIHRYGDSKGKRVYVGSWPVSMHYPYPQPKLDFVTKTPTSREVLDKRFVESAWDDELAGIRDAFGNIPVFAFVDWADDGAPLSVFSQQLSKSEQSEFLVMADGFFASKGIKFVYPLHGGHLGKVPQCSLMVGRHGMILWPRNFRLMGPSKSLPRARKLFLRFLPNYQGTCN